ILHFSLAMLFLLILHGIVARFLSDKPRLPRMMIPLFLVAALSGTGIFRISFLVIETDALVITLLAASVLAGCYRRTGLAVYLYALTFLVNYQFLFLAPLYLIVMAKERLCFSRIWCIALIVLTGFAYLPARTDAQYSHDPGLNSPAQFFRYLALKEYKVKANLDRESHAVIADFKREYPIWSWLLLLFLPAALTSKGIRREGWFPAAGFLLYLLFFAYVARASVKNSLHYSMPLVFLGIVSLAGAGRTRILAFAGAAMVLGPGGADCLKIYRDRIPQHYAELSLQGIDSGIFFVARDCHINYFRWLLRKNSKVIPVNVADLARKTCRIRLSRRLGYELPDAAVPDLVNLIIAREHLRKRVFFENDPLFEFVNHPSAQQGLRKEAYGQRKLLVADRLPVMSWDYSGPDEEIRNLLVTFRSSLFPELLDVILHDPDKSYSVFKRCYPVRQPWDSYFRQGLQRAAAGFIRENNMKRAVSCYRIILDMDPLDRDAGTMLENLERQ
ncbi:MAG: hypothetical protein PHQ23_14745, partial [Candidatus Wallbacteria bacterium]|nr:hypothetical protein [Candidatus Wallbacteria bacterium]